MPTNKNALVRYRHLDRLLSDHHHYYDIHDLTEKVNDLLEFDGFSPVTQRCIEKDLIDMQGLFSAQLNTKRKIPRIVSFIGIDRSQYFLKR